MKITTTENNNNNNICTISLMLRRILEFLTLLTAFMGVPIPDKKRRKKRIVF
jgi:hypothetical protein